ncbi:MAG: hypothetical protein K6A44_03415 [bacterium]|nr:hypothetical protein [bacterium]
MSNEVRRWYDRDPLLSKMMRVLKNSDDDFQIKMAINLIKVIIEHHIDTDQFQSINDIMMAVQDGHIDKGNARWYDADNTLRTAIQMLESCPPDMQRRITKDIAEKIINEFNQIDKKNQESDEEPEGVDITDENE